MPARPSDEARSARWVGAPPAALPEARVGPNAVIQLAAALDAAAGRSVTADVFERAAAAHYLKEAPCSLVPEADVRRLFAALRSTVGEDAARSILADAGRRTGAYILANRIPKLAQRVIGLLPPPLAIRVLSAAIVRHAWTFAGSGRVAFAARPEPTITIARNRLATPGCPWHGAVFETLYLAIVAPDMAIRHVDCCGSGADACHFVITRRVGRR